MASTVPVETSFQSSNFDSMGGVPSGSPNANASKLNGSVSAGIQAITFDGQFVSLPVSVACKITKRPR